MSKTHIFFNPIAGNGRCEENRKLLDTTPWENPSYWDLTDPKTYKEGLETLTEQDALILCGGDGTLNRFVNTVDVETIPCEIFYCPMGTGNDFAHDLGYADGDKPIAIKQYLQSLPSVEVNGKNCRFVNGVGYGIDGYCCEVGDKLRATPGQKVNYTSIAIKGLLFHYKPTAAVVTVDGVAHKYKKVWLAPTMNGRFYGGGMMPTPDQQRNGGKVSVMVMHDSGKLHTLMVFPSIFKGEHVKHTKLVDVFCGSEISVEFDRPTALQIDGETILNVTRYTAKAYEE